MSGESGCFRGDYACVLFHFARKAAGAASARHSLRPLIQKAERKSKTRAKSRRENVELWLFEN
jgi:hypothetical protein